MGAEPHVRSDGASLHRVHISSAPEDAMHVRELRKHLHALRTSSMHVEVTSDADILPGQDRLRARNSLIDAATITLLLASIDFITSEECRNDMERAFTRLATAMSASDGGSYRAPPNLPNVPVVAFVLCRPYDWAPNPPPPEVFILPTNRLPVSNWPDRDIAYTHITSHVRRLLCAGKPFDTGRPENRWRREYTIGVVALLILLLGLAASLPHAAYVSEAIETPTLAVFLAGHLISSIWPLLAYLVPVLLGLNEIRLFFSLSPLQRSTNAASKQPARPSCNFCDESAQDLPAPFTMMVPLSKFGDSKNRCEWCTAFHTVLRRIGKSFVAPTYFIFLSISVLVLPALEGMASGTASRIGIAIFATTIALILARITAGRVASLAQNIFASAYTPQRDVPLGKQERKSQRS